MVLVWRNTLPERGRLTRGGGLHRGEEAETLQLFRKALDMTKADIYQFISKQKLGVLGTLSPGGSPQSALVGIAVTPELEIIFDTVKSSRKFQNLMSNSGCSFVVG
jgi:Pyridoxamine 5'-phosphate oxidase